MGLLKKKTGADFIDFTMLQKRGILKKSEQTSDIIDVTSSAANASSTNSSSPFGFLDNLASSASSMASAEQSEVNALKLKIDDVEYKLERLVEKLSLIESKLEAFERKIV